MIIPEYLKNIKSYFIETENFGKIFNTTHPFPTHLSGCRDLTWAKVWDDKASRECFELCYKDEWEEQEGIRLITDTNYLIPILKRCNINMKDS